ncbi:MAG: hypothetical protein AAGF10_00935 [Verrucomicrobiota bacterium]
MTNPHAPIRAALIAALTLALCPLLAQAALKVNSGDISNRALFGVGFPDGTSFYADARMVYGVSLQRYQTGPFYVTEMVIDIGGVVSQFRIYATEPFDESAWQSRLPAQAPSGLKEGTGVPAAVQKAASRGKQTISSTESGLVVKDYPVSTHAKTVEFRLAQAKDVEDLYDAFVQAYTRRGRDEVVSRNETDGETTQEINRLGGTFFSFDKGGAFPLSRRVSIRDAQSYEPPQAVPYRRAQRDQPGNTLRAVDLRRW